MKEIDLINFEDNIATLFNDAKIKAPIHLYSGNEEFLIKFFKKIKKMIGFYVLGGRTINVC